MDYKEKAEELVNRFDLPSGLMSVERKQCALICVDEILKASPSLPILADNGSFGSDIEESTKWWQQVKTEIEKL
jgi:hypothetical protein